MGKIDRKYLYFSFGFILILSFIVGLFLYFICKPSNYSAQKTIIIDYPGNNAYVSEVLCDNEISNNYKLTKIAVRILKMFDIQAKFGEFELPEKASIIEALRILDGGRNVIHKITIPEGFSVLQVMKRLEKNEHLKGEITEIPEEGMMMPDTYVSKYPETRQSIIQRSQKAMKEFLEQEWPKRSSNCVVKTPYEALILASIVEKETFSERESVAGVYSHRLKIGMRLQADPTVIYGIKKGDKFGRSLKYADLKIDNPYNTYRNKGLPPTPITNAGRACILAVLHPVPTKNLFFVYDNSVSQHVFSETYQEHKRHIARIRKKKLSEIK